MARKELERRYHSLVRQKKRAYHLERLKQLLVDERMRPRRFWKALRAKHSDLPNGFQRVQAWGSYIGHLSHCGSAEGCSLPGVAYPQQPHADALNVPISLQEVLDGLHKLHNGRSTGSLGIPAELYRYAHAPASSGEAPPQHLLAPTLTKVLNSIFQSGTEPACVNEGLVTPVFKDAVLDKKHSRLTLLTSGKFDKQQCPQHAPANSEKTMQAVICFGS